MARLTAPSALTTGVTSASYHVPEETEPSDDTTVGLIAGWTSHVSVDSLQVASDAWKSPPLSDGSTQYSRSLADCTARLPIPDTENRTNWRLTGLLSAVMWVDPP